MCGLVCSFSVWSSTWIAACPQFEGTKRARGGRLALCLVHRSPPKCWLSWSDDDSRWPKKKQREEGWASSGRPDPVETVLKVTEHKHGAAVGHTDATRSGFVIQGNMIFRKIQPGACRAWLTRVSRFDTQPHSWCYLLLLNRGRGSSWAPIYHTSYFLIRPSRALPSEVLWHAEFTLIALRTF